MSILAAAVEDACGSDPSTLCQFFYNLTENDTVASFADVARTPIAIVIILAVAWIINRYVRRAITRFVDRVVRLHEDEVINSSNLRAEQRTRTLGQVLRNGASIIIYTIAIVIALGELEINLGPLIASAGIVGVALGFGSQSLVRDFLSGIFMLIEDQYGVGDVIDVGEAVGVVEAVNLRTTELRDVYGTLWHVPNGEIRRVANKSQTWARTVLDIDVAYDTDIDHAMRVIKEVADSVWHEKLDKATILEEPEVWGVEAFRADSVAIRLAVKVEPAEQWTTARIIRGRLKVAFDREGIQIPFPQRTVWMRTVKDDDEPNEPGGEPANTGEKFTPSPSPKGEANT